MAGGLTWLRRVGYLLLAVGFATVAGLQWNDPDPTLWMVIYGSAALLSLISALGSARMPATLVRGWQALLGVTIAGTLAYAGYLAALYFGGYSATPMGSAEPVSALPWYKIEEPRELIGLMVVSAVLGSQLLWLRVRRRRGSPA